MVGFNLELVQFHFNLLSTLHLSFLAALFSSSLALDRSSTLQLHLDMGPPPLPPKHTGSRDFGHSTIHFRRSSTVDDDGEVQPFLPRSTGSPSSSIETVVDLDDVDYRSPAAGEKGEYYKNGRQGSETKAGYLTWEDRSARRRKGSKTCLWIMLLFCVGAGGWLVGLMTKDAPLPATVAEAVLRQREVKL